MKLPRRFREKKLIVFDLDGTLAPTKAVMHRDMASLLSQLLAVKGVVVIGGGKYQLFKTQLLAALACPRKLLYNLFLFPTTATAFYRYRDGWKRVYALELSSRERAQIKKAFRDVFREIRYVHPTKTYGRVIEDRRTQVTFSALGQEVVAMLGEAKGVRLKERWKREHTGTKLVIARLLQKRLPRLEVHAAGFTSIDVTRKGIDKAYGLRQIVKHLRIPIKNMLFVGDAIFLGGNDYAVVRTGVDYVKVRGPEDAKAVIRFLLSTSSPQNMKRER